ncbi:MAG: HAD-IB family phosphatase [Candidatus Lokiarchaeota archaeon]|nr:HAD-IB family phosphatase [Candidatus Lokiarchaeota archaeon]
MNQNIELMIFDMDGTLTKEPNSWGLIHSELQVALQAKKNAELYYSKKIDYIRWAELDISLWVKKQLHYQQLKKIISSKIEPIDGAIETIAELKRNNIKTLIISSGLDIICDHFKKILNYDHYFANRLIFDNYKRLKEIEVIVGFNKDEILKKYLQEHEIPLSKTLSCGDNINDIKLFNCTPISIALNPKDESLEDHATHILYTDNLEDILEIILK